MYLYIIYMAMMKYQSATTALPPLIKYQMLTFSPPVDISLSALQSVWAEQGRDEQKGNTELVNNQIRVYKCFNGI
jgi:hypothetical protein